MQYGSLKYVYRFFSSQKWLNLSFRMNEKYNSAGSCCIAGWLDDSEISILNSELPFHGRKLRRQKEPRRENLAEINSRKKEAWGWTKTTLLACLRDLTFSPGIPSVFYPSNFLLCLFNPNETMPSASDSEFFLLTFVHAISGHNCTPPARPVITYYFGVCAYIWVL